MRTLALSMVLLAPLSLSAQTPTGEAYDALIDRVFSVADDGVNILRFFRSSSEPELQVVFTIPFEGGKCSARVWHLPESAEPLLVRFIARLEASPGLTFEAAARGLTAIETTVTVPCDGQLARRMQAIGELSVPIPRTYAVAVHGTAFQLEVRNGSRRLMFETNAGGLDGSYPEQPVVDWMASIGRAFRDAVRR